MKNLLKAILLGLMCISINTSFAQTKKKADKETVQWRYEIENLGQKSSHGGHGTAHILKVWSYSKKADIAEEQSKKNAIHAVVFQGVPSNEVKRINGIEPLIQDPTIEATHADFLERFFATGGDYMRFVTITNGGMADVIKVSKEYKVGLTVSVNTAGLRKYLEQHGVIVALDKADGLAKNPSVIVVPSRAWCERNGFMNKVDVMGEIVSVPDYRRAFDMSADLNNITAKIGNLMSSRGYDLRLISRVLTNIDTENAEDAVMTSETSGAMVVETPIDKLRRVARADIWMEVDWQVNELGMKKSVTFNLSGIDAYTDQQIANSQGTGQPTFSDEIPVLFEQAVINNLDNFNEQLQSKLMEWAELGRSVTIQFKCFDACDYNFHTEFDGEELGFIIEDYLCEITTDGQCSPDFANANEMYFSNVHIPTLDEKGRTMDARRFGRMIQSMLRYEYQIDAKIDTKGLGGVVIIIGEK